MSTITPFIVVTIFLVTFSPCLYFVLGADDKGLATWYGPETGSGKAAACGWDNDSKDPPFSSMIAAGNAKFFLKGKGCGNCYEVFCSRKPHCTGKPIKITITDECPGKCNDIPYHFDLSGHAFGLMGPPAQAHALRMLGQVDIQFKKVPCSYGATKIAFKIDAKTNPFWFATAIEYVNGDGSLSKVEMASAGSPLFTPMKNTWGAVWQKDTAVLFKPPYSFKLTSGDGKTITATNAVPANYKPGQKYSSTVNF
ncbi:hypothetical protein L2E82_11698 [Cichorium intybus]|uniref:Uncharacterized protein n=1 Tax=Cichorium intybus TaxID=13427 RepID=A0ACB9GG03_CICIN|nr:hypothetical protein L2E82_11698 [Cichorium intybus]